MVRHAGRYRPAGHPGSTGPSGLVALDLQGVVRELWRSKLLLTLAGLAGLAGATAIAYSLPRTYVAEGSLVVRAEAAVAPDAERAYYSTTLNDSAVTTERDVLVARGLIARVADSVPFPPGLDRSGPGLVGRAMAWLGQHGVPVPSQAHDPARDAMELEDRRVEMVARAIGTSADKGSSVITVRGASPDPQFSAAIAGRLITLYMQDRLAAQQAANKNVEVALRERLQQTRADIAESEAKVATLMLQPNLVENAEVPGAARQLTLIGTRLADAQSELATRRAVYQQALKLRDSARGDPAAMVAMLDAGTQSTADLRRLYSAAQSDLARVSGDAGPNNPARIAAQQVVSDFAARLSGEGQRLLAQRQSELVAAEQTVASLSSQYDALRKSSSQGSPRLLDLDRERETLQNLRRVAGTIEDRLIAVVAQPIDANARVLTMPSVPLLAAFPNKPMFAAAGLLVSLALAVLAVLIRSFVRLARPTLIRQVDVFGTRLLGSIPELRRSVLRGGHLPAVFQALALEVERIVDKEGMQVLTVTSGEPNEGKTTVATSLAMTLSRMGRRVLLVNCDLHQAMGAVKRLRPAHEAEAHGTEGGASLPCLTVDPESGLHIARAADPGARDPVMALRSREFADGLAAARKRYDVVICDTPPVLSVPDALVAGQLSDGFILVAQAGAVDAAASQEIIRRLQTTGHPVVGVVATKVPSQDFALSSYTGYGAKGAERSITRALTLQVTP